MRIGLMPATMRRRPHTAGIFCKPESNPKPECSRPRDVDGDLLLGYVGHVLSQGGGEVGLVFLLLAQDLADSGQLREYIGSLTPLQLFDVDPFH